MDITAEMLSRLTRNIDKTIEKGVGSELIRIDPCRGDLNQLVIQSTSIEKKHWQIRSQKNY